VTHQSKFGAYWPRFVTHKPKQQLTTVSRTRFSKSASRPESWACIPPTYHPRACIVNVGRCNSLANKANHSKAGGAFPRRHTCLAWLLLWCGRNNRSLNNPSCSWNNPSCPGTTHHALGTTHLTIDHTHPNGGDVSRNGTAEARRRDVTGVTEEPIPSRSVARGHLPQYLGHCICKAIGSLTHRSRSRL
jgi:hypothetical protein